MTRRALVAAALVLMAMAAGCSRRAAPAANQSNAPARRVVSVSPSTTEALFAVGAGDRVVGRSRFCDWPPEATKLPTVGGVIDSDVEAILALEPDLVVGSPGPASARLGERLAKFGVATWFPEVDSLAEVDAMILGMGERTGHEAQAKDVAGAVDARAAGVEHAIAGASMPRVLLVVDIGPVVATGPKDFLDELLRRAGGTNVLTQGPSWQTLDFEQIVGLDPDVVVDVSAANSGEVARIRPETPGWKEVRAVREGHVKTLADARILRPGPRIAEGLAVLARALHPDAPIPSVPSPSGEAANPSGG
jgi:iron complex transport system substrate-binding protein